MWLVGEGEYKLVNLMNNKNKINAAAAAASALPSFRISMPVRKQPIIFGGGRQNITPVINRRIRWIARGDIPAFRHLQRQITTLFLELCRKHNDVNPHISLKQIDTASALIVVEEMVPILDKSTGKIIPAKPMMPPNVYLQMTGFIVIRLNEASISNQTLIIDLICTIPGRSQAKAMIEFVIQKAQDLGFHSIQFGNTNERTSIQKMIDDDDDDDDTEEDNDDDNDDDDDDDDTLRGGYTSTTSSMTIITKPSVQHLYGNLMRYLETQRIFIPKCGGHLMQF